ncbi:Cytochrome P450 [Sphingomonas sp. YR710]|jgi:cytochrome P450|uniref:cytochrome P450 n=1 Tax=Sphingomonas sp. YR710 TaxID=1882773 RepID=UPI00087E5ED0|nr:cytochrome P450 [Sphingomonas sp. YR710]SDD27161.1 Cytochrome P450 [Sphingomonas sp. YR710]
MSNNAAASAVCPVHAGRDDRKTADTVKAGLPVFPNSRVTENFRFARDVMRSPEMRQAAGDADSIVFDNPAEISFFFLDGELHKRRRASVAGYFAPKAIVSRYHPLMKATMDRLVAEFQAKGSAVVDEMSLELASDVTMEIVGLTNSDNKALTQRIKTIMGSHNSFDKRRWYRFTHDKLFGWYHTAIKAWRVMELFKKDIAPAIAARKDNPRDDVMSYMIQNNYSKKGMLIEIMTYAGAGVSTTREFMVMAVWQLWDHPELMERFLNGSEEEQFAIIEEILRIEPIAGYLYRRPVADVPETAEGTIKEGQLVAIDIRGVNADPSIVGECPYQLDPDRAKRQKIAGSWMSFGDGPHRCPGSQVALHETRFFLDRLLRVPGFKLVTPPKVGWSLSTQGYELREAVVTCDRV